MPEPGRRSPASRAWLHAWGTACLASPIAFDLEPRKAADVLKMRTGFIYVKQKD